MRNIVQLHLNRMFRSVFFLAVVLLTLGCFLGFSLIGIESVGVTFVSYIIKFDYYAYFEVVLTVIAFCTAVYFFRQESMLEVICFYPKVKVLWGKMLATLGGSLSLCVIPAAFVLIHAAMEQTELSFTVAALLYAVIRWALIILAAQSTAFLAAYLIRSPAVYALSLAACVLFTYLNDTILTWLFDFDETGEKLSNFFSMQQPFMTGVDVEYVGARLDLFLWSKVLYVALFAAVVFALIWLLCGRHKKLPAALLAALLLAQAGSISAWFMLYPRHYAYEEKLFPTAAAEQAASIRSYRGSLKLSEFSQFACEVELLPAGAQTVTFRLDAGLDVTEVTGDGQALPYTREGEYVTVELPQGASDPVRLSFRYAGRIYYVSNISSVNIYSSLNGAALPPLLAFLPVIDGDDTEKSYQLDVQAHNTVVSNLDVRETGRHRYELTGEARTCCIFSGYFSEYEENGITFYRAKYNQITDYPETYARSLTYRYFDAFSQEYVEGPYQQPEKVFLIYSRYGILGFPIVYDGYVLVNYGDPSS